MLKVCVDFNGVLANTSEALCEVLKHDVGIVVPTRTFSKAMVGKNFPNVVKGGRPKVLSHRRYAEVKSKLFDTGEFLSINPMPDAVSGVSALLAAGHEVRVVSDAKTVSKEQIWAWFAWHGIPQLDIVLTRHTTKEVQQCCCDFVIDNEPEQLIPLIGRDSPRLVHFLPPEGAAGCDIATMSSHAGIRSLRGWAEVVPYVLYERELAA